MFSIARAMASDRPYGFFGRGNQPSRYVAVAPLFQEGAGGRPNRQTVSAYSRQSSTAEQSLFVPRVVDDLQQQEHRPTQHQHPQYPGHRVTNRAIHTCRYPTGSLGLVDARHVEEPPSSQAGSR